MLTPPRLFAGAEALAAGLAGDVTAIVADALAARGVAALALAGGRTPALFLRRLAERAAEWSNVVVTLTDERWVPADHPDSNEGLVRALLVSKVAGIRLVPLFTGAPTPEEGTAACAAALGALPLPFDVVILGMGEDGHVASLWPVTPGLTAAFTDPSPGRAMRPPGTAQPRMTLTLPTLLNSRRIVLLLSGESKRRVLDLAMQDGSAEDMPVRAVLRQEHVDITVYWAP